MKKFLTSMTGFLGGLSLVISQPYFDVASFNAGFGPVTTNYNQFYLYEGQVQVPITLPSDNILILAAGGSQSILESKNGLFQYELTNLTFRVGYNIQINEKRKLLLMAINRYNSNNLRYKAEDIQIGGLLLWSNKLHDNFTYSLGLYVNPEFFGPLITPIIGFDRKFNDRSRVFGNFPFTFTYVYKLSEVLETGVYFIGLVSSFNQPQIGNFHIQRGFNQLTPYLDYYVTKNLVVQLKPGLLIGSKFKMYQENDQIDWALSALKFGDNRQVQSEIDASGLFVQVGVIYRVRID